MDGGPELPAHLAERVFGESRRASAGGELVLYWMRTAMRGHENPALEVAALTAAHLGLPLLVYQGLSERHPYASDRHHAFVLEGAQDVARELAGRGVRYALHVGRPGARGPHLRALAARAGCVVTEAMPVAPLAHWTESLRRSSGVPVLRVDTACVVPMPAVEELHERAFDFRRATARLRDARLVREWPTLALDVPPFDGELSFESVEAASADIAALVADCAIDHAVGPVPHTRGGSSAGYARWRAFRDERLARYARDRNDPLRDGVSRLSPYLHYGMVSPLRIAREARAVGGSGPEKFLDELCVWRELAYSFCHRALARSIDPGSVTALPPWARDTLREHERDARGALPSWETLARGRTGDALWDAAQRSLLVHGELHNNVRMTWGKALLGWTRSAGEALARLVDLNHRYALDGRDPSSYGGILWCLGQFDRPLPPARAVTGTVRRRPTAAHARRLDVARYVERTSRAAKLPMQVAVVGAGIAGLAAARALADHGHSVRVFEKGRGPGGRASTRRVDRARFDHGAQYFTARDERFRRHVDAWIEDGVAARWTGRVVSLHEGRVEASDAPPERLVGVPGMSSIAGHLARDVDVLRGVRVERVERSGSSWRLEAAGAELGRFDALLVTAPPAQAAELVADTGSDVLDALRDVRMRPCWAVMLELEERLDVTFDGAFVQHSRLSWIARDSSKPGRPAGERWVLHAAPDWSAAHLDDAESDVVAALARELERHVDRALPRPSLALAHRWRFALADPPLEGGALWDGGLALGCGGDWCHGSRVEGAFLSGAALAGRVLATSG